MFTGIIEEIGKIVKTENNKKFRTFYVGTKSILKKKKPGQSIAVNGACMTIKEIKKDVFVFDAIPESLEKTNLKTLKKDDIVNLESALKMGQELDGHMVQGHVDCEGTVVKLAEAKKHTILQIQYPPSIGKYMALKGSITINGVSLTISDLSKKTFSVDLIPFTLKKTNLSKLKKGDKVNLETDMIAKYLNSILNGQK
jgi:riboflavin synthase